MSTTLRAHMQAGLSLHRLSLHRRLPRLLRATVACVAALTVCLAAPAAEPQSRSSRPGWLDGVGAAIGSSDGDWTARVALVSDWGRAWDLWGARLTGYWDGSFGYWDVHQKPGRPHGMVDIGFTPMLRVLPVVGGNVSPYLEAGIGVHLLSNAVHSDSSHVSTAFQVGDQAGFGVRFGDGGRYEIGYRFHHLSNGGIKRPNGGIDLHLLRLTYRLE